MINISQLDFAYPGKDKLFTGLSLHLKANESILLKGENGCGKSTLLKLIIGILKPEKGTISISGKTIDKLNSTIFSSVFYQAQETEENLIGISPAQDWSIWQLAINNLPNFESEDKLFTELSTGEKKQASQRILPYLLDRFWLIDEPFSGLDSAAVNALNLLLHKKKASQTGLLLITHEDNMGEDFFDRIIELRNGQIIEIKP